MPHSESPYSICSLSLGNEGEFSIPLKERRTISQYISTHTHKQHELHDEVYAVLLVFVLHAKLLHKAQQLIVTRAIRTARG